MPTDEIRAQIGENLRFTGDMRFKQLTLLTGVFAAVGAGLASYDGTKVILPGISIPPMLCAFALLFTAVAWVMEVRSTLHWVAQREAAPELWPRHESVRFFRWLNATNAVLAFHIAAYVFWLFCAWRLGIGVWASTGYLLLGMLLLVFSAIEYWRKLWS